MHPPKITAAKAITSRVLHVEFTSGEARRYDISALLTREMFAPLKNPALFNAVTVEPGGYAVSWGGEIDISENELWAGGEAVSGETKLVL